MLSNRSEVQQNKEQKSLDMNPLSQPFDQFIESPESKQLASTLAVELKQHLKLRRFSPLYEYHLAKVILNLYQAWSSNPDKCVAISRRKNFYDEDQGIYQNKKLSYTFMVGCLDGLMELGYVDLIMLGHKDPITDKFYTSCYQPSQALQALFTEYEFNHQAITKEPTAVAVLLRDKKPKKTKTNPNPRGKLLNYRPTQHNRTMSKNLKTINAALQDTDINLYVTDKEMIELNQRMAGKNKEDPSRLPDVQFSRKWLYRVFNESFERGGRFYGGFWQEIPSKYRSRITMDHCVITEIDFDSLHPAMLYLREGYTKDYYQDPYQLTGSIGSKMFDEVKLPRKAIKIAMNIMLNSLNRQKALGAIKNSGLERPSGYKSWAQLVDAIEQYHSPIAHNFYSGVGSELQYLDSQIVETVLLELIKENTIALPVHDSFLCKLKDLGLLIGKMNVATQQHLGSELFITLDPPKLERPDTVPTTEFGDYFSRRSNYLKKAGAVEADKEPHLI